MGRRGRLVLSFSSWEAARAHPLANTKDTHMRVCVRKRGCDSGNSTREGWNHIKHQKKKSWRKPVHTSVGFVFFFSIARFSPVQIISPFCPCVQAQHSESHKPLEGLFSAGFASKLVVSELFLSSSWVNCVTGGCGIILVPSAGNFWKQKVPGVIGLLVSLRPRIWVSQAGRAPQGLSLPNPELELLSPPLPGGEEGQIKIFFFFF